jgi:ABC transporter substrate binding protein
VKRREFITLLGGAAAWPRAARAQQRAVPVIGFLGATAAAPDTDYFNLRAFRQGLKDTGYVEGENVAIEYRYAEDQHERLPALADDLVRRRVAVIATVHGPTVAYAAKAATQAIPIVFAVAEDPVKLGLVASLARPGGNLTGVNLFSAELVAKRLELLHDLVPAAARVAVLINPANPAFAETTLRDIEPAARAFGLQIQVLKARHEPRDQCGVREPCARAARRSVRFHQSVFHDPAYSNGPTRSALRDPGDLFRTAIRRSRGADELRLQRCGWVVSTRRLRRPHIKRRKTRRPAGRAGEQVGARHQSPDRQDAWPRCAADAPRPRRRGDRVM